jgi:hypothetical protein
MNISWPIGLSFSVLFLTSSSAKTKIMNIIDDYLDIWGVAVAIVVVVVSYLQ